MTVRQAVSDISDDTDMKESVIIESAPRVVTISVCGKGEAENRMEQREIPTPTHFTLVSIMFMYM